MERDALSYLSERIPLHEIRKMMEKNGFSVEEIAEAVERMEASGEPLHDTDEAFAPFAPFDPFVPPDTSKLPPFPVDKLPPVLKYMAKAAAENIQVAVDMTAIAGLTAAALCIQGKFVISPKPGWIEPLNLYAAVVARPSERKTPALAVMTRPIHQFEKEENERRAPLVEQYRTKKMILEKRIVNLKERAAKPGKNIDGAMDESQSCKQSWRTWRRKRSSPCACWPMTPPRRRWSP